VNHTLKHAPVTQSGFINTLNLISSLYLVFIRFSARYRTISYSQWTRIDIRKDRVKQPLQCDNKLERKEEQTIQRAHISCHNFKLYFLPRQNFEVWKCMRIYRSHTAVWRPIDWGVRNVQHRRRRSPNVTTQPAKSTLIYENKHKGQCTLNVPLRQVRVTNVAVEKREVLYILRVCFSFRYPAAYCHPLHDWL
jgi:hypothetical protein